MKNGYNNKIDKYIESQRAKLNEHLDLFDACVTSGGNAAIIKSKISRCQGAIEAAKEIKELIVV